MPVIRVVIHELDKGRYMKGTTRNISIPDHGREKKPDGSKVPYEQKVTVDEVTNIILNSLAHNHIKYTNKWKNHNGTQPARSDPEEV